MASGDELRNKAREFERAHRPADALEVYLQVVEELEGGSAAETWQRIGKLQEQTGDRDAASSSYARAVDLFASAGQANNALALCESIGDEETAAPSVRLARLRWALELGYPAFARDAIVPLVLSAVRDGDDMDVDEQIATFLAKHGTDPRCTPGALVERLPAAEEKQAAVVLSRVWRILSETGATGMADRVRSEILRIDPNADPRPDAAPPGGRNNDEPEAATVPLIVPTALEDDDAALDIPRLEGLEPTHAGLERERPPAELHDPQPTPPAGMVAPSPAGPLVEDADPGDETADDWPEEDDENEPLPLLAQTDRNARQNRPASPGAGSPSPTVSEGAESADDSADGADLSDILLSGRDSGIATPDLDVPAISRELERITTRDVEPTDAGSHYDVGVAFKEMGMIDDAIANLVAALARGHNPVATLEVLGEILIGQDRFESAARVLEFARSAEAEHDEAMAGVLYWLARSDEIRGRTDDARALLARVIRVAPAYRDASQRLASL